jgi:hypothetical protein
VTLITVPLRRPTGKHSNVIALSALVNAGVARRPVRGKRSDVIARSAQLNAGAQLERALAPQRADDRHERRATRPESTVRHARLTRSTANGSTSGREASSAEPSCSATDSRASIHV